MRIALALYLALIPSISYAQLYSGVIDSARATTNWTLSGATIKTEGHTCNNYTTATSLATLNAGISTCSSGSSSSNVGLINLAAGTYTYAGGVNLKSNVILRGAGMTTILNITSTSGTAWLGGGSNGSIAMVGSFASWADSNPTMLGYGSTGKTWTGTNGSSGTYTKGATVLNLGSTPTGLSVGDELICWENNESSFPISGYFVGSHTSNSPTGISLAGTYYDFGGSTELRSIVTNVSGTQVTITDGLVHPTGVWKTSLTPMCGWIVSSDLIQNAGLENLLINTKNNATVQDTVIGMWFAFNCWVKGVGITPYYKAFHVGGAVNFVTTLNDSLHVTFRDNWTDRAQGGGSSTTTTYGTVLQATHFSLVENNIYNNVESPNPILIAGTGNVYTFNYENYVHDDGQEGGLQFHDPASALTLVEGNKYAKVWVDAFHGNSNLNTLFRNHFSSDGIDVWTYNRWYNLIGNVINSSTAYKGCESDVTKYGRGDGVAFRLGYPSSTASSADSNEGGYAGTISADPLVCSTSMIWGNYSAFGATAHFDSSDVPSGDSVFPNAVPASHTLPASFRYSVSPSWWPTGVTWPIIGPDVTGGTYVSGYARKTPAQLCLEASGGVDGSSDLTDIVNFSPSTCYDGGGAGQSTSGGGAVTAGAAPGRMHR